uniref:Ribosomal protein S8 n=1 Tax=Volvocales sp. NrCl902 TaxID=2682054 RepID=A0A7G1GGA2_9CHLO|nr:ribosomal protein S8 [Volvocales sp. NrCl902]
MQKISDTLTRIRNASLAKKPHAILTYSNINLEIIKILEREGFIQGFQIIFGSKLVVDDSQAKKTQPVSSTKKQIIVFLKYYYRKTRDNTNTSPTYSLRSSFALRAPSKDFASLSAKRASSPKGKAILSQICAKRETVGPGSRGSPKGIEKLWCPFPSSARSAKPKVLRFAQGKGELDIARERDSTEQGVPAGKGKLGKEVQLLSQLTQGGKGAVQRANGCKGLIKQPFITNLKIISKPSLRIYSKVCNIPRFLGGTGIVILSTPKGIMTDREARLQSLGGELLCYVW